MLYISSTNLTRVKKDPLRYSTLDGISISLHLDLLNPLLTIRFRHDPWTNVTWQNCQHRANHLSSISLHSRDHGVLHSIWMLPFQYVSVRTSWTGWLHTKSLAPWFHIWSYRSSIVIAKWIMKSAFFLECEELWGVYSFRHLAKCFHVSASPLSLFSPGSRLRMGVALNASNSMHLRDAVWEKSRSRHQSRNLAKDASHTANHSFVSRLRAEVL